MFILEEYTAALQQKMEQWWQTTEECQRLSMNVRPSVRPVLTLQVLAPVLTLMLEDNDFYRRYVESVDQATKELDTQFKKNKRKAEEEDTCDAFVYRCFLEEEKKRAKKETAEKRPEKPVEEKKRAKKKTAEKRAEKPVEEEAAEKKRKAEEKKKATEEAAEEKKKAEEEAAEEKGKAEEEALGRLLQKARHESETFDSRVKYISMHSSSLT